MTAPNSLSADFSSLLPSTPFSRRRFVVTALGAGFALSVQPVVAQTAITTDDKGLIAGEIKVPAGGGEMPAYRAQPAKGSAFPVLLVVHEIFGVHEYIKDVCRRLAKQGYQAIAPELFARQGDPRAHTSIAELQSAIVAKVSDAQVLADLDACVAWAKAHGGDTERLGVTGFCWGGRIVWLYDAHNPQVKAAVAWYGRVAGETSALTPTNPIDVAAHLNGPVLGLYGGEDQGIPLDSLDRMRKALAASGRPAPAGHASTIHVYPHAGHAFHSDYRPSYRKEEAEDGWARMLTWFKQLGV
jgi:carboxymethylenebutenolidase